MALVNDVLNELKYSLYLIFHPFDGFWDLKHEKRGSLRSAVVILFLFIMTFMLKSQFSGYIFSVDILERKSLLVQFTSILIPFILWCVSNWCITSLVDGEGGFIDICITSAFSLVPIILVYIPLILLSNFFGSGEITFYNILSVIPIIWSGFLLFTGIMTLYQFSVLKTVSTVLIAIAGVLIIVFLCILFLTVLQQMFDLFNDVYREWLLRS